MLLREKTLTEVEINSTFKKQPEKCYFRNSDWLKIIPLCSLKCEVEIGLRICLVSSNQIKTFSQKVFLSEYAVSR